MIFAGSPESCSAMHRRGEKCQRLQEKEFVPLPFGPWSQAHKQNRLDLFGNIQEVGFSVAEKKTDKETFLPSTFGRHFSTKSGRSSKRFEAGYVRASGRGIPVRVAALENENRYESMIVRV